MADYTIKQNDTGPYIEVTLEDANGPVDLSGAESVKMNMLHEKGSKILGIVMTPVGTGSDGKYKHQWAKAEGETPAELHEAGAWTAEFKVMQAGRRTTFPSDVTKTITVVSEIA